VGKTTAKKGRDPARSRPQAIKFLVPVQETSNIKIAVGHSRFKYTNRVAKRFRRKQLLTF